jgi:amidase
LEKYNLQALLVPSDNFSPSTEIPAMAGYPMVTIPAGIDGWGKLKINIDGFARVR